MYSSFVSAGTCFGVKMKFYLEIYLLGKCSGKIFKFGSEIFKFGAEIFKFGTENEILP